MSTDSATKERAQGARASSERETNESSKQKSAQKRSVPWRLPGTSFDAAIPPTDSPEYARLQQAYGTSDFLGLLRD